MTSPWCLCVDVITTAHLNSTKLTFCPGSNPAHDVLEICDGEDLQQWSQQKTVHHHYQHHHIYLALRPVWYPHFFFFSETKTYPEYKRKILNRFLIEISAINLQLKSYPKSLTSFNPFNANCPFKQTQPTNL